MIDESRELYKIGVNTIDGNASTLAAYQGQVLLIVNVASRCGFTPQYKELEQLYNDYKARGFAVLGFPCDQFLGQEPGTNEEINEFAVSCFRVTFPLFAKVKVNGTERAPLYTYLAKHIEKRSLKFIPWNFTKIIVDREGRIIRRYLPTASFTTLRKVIEDLLLARYDHND